MKKEPAFATEADLCAAFIARIGDDWTAYAETAGWDILLVRKSDGAQVGIEAKLKLNAHVVQQALEGLRNAWTRTGPDYRAVLVPDNASIAGVGALAAAIGITVIHVGPRDESYRRFRPELPTVNAYYRNEQWHEWMPTERHHLPDFVPDVAAGSPAPVQLTSWKIGALKIAVLLEVRGIVHRTDFKAIGIDARRWTDKWTGWLQPTPAGYAAGKGMPDFKGQHPKIYADLLATIADWAPPASLPMRLPPPAQQPDLLDQPADEKETP